MPELHIEELRRAQEIGTYHSPAVPGIRSSDIGIHFPEFKSLSSDDQAIVLEVSEGTTRTEAIILSQNSVYWFEHVIGGGYKVRRITLRLVKSPEVPLSGTNYGNKSSERSFRVVAIASLFSAVLILVSTVVSFYQVHLLRTKSSVGDALSGSPSDIKGLPEKTFYYADSHGDRLARTSDIANARKRANAKAIYLLFKGDKNLLSKGETEVEKAVSNVLSEEPGDKPE